MKKSLWRMKYVLFANFIATMGLSLISVRSSLILGVLYVATGIAIHAVFRADGSLRGWVAGCGPPTKPSTKP